MPEDNEEWADWEESFGENPDPKIPYFKVCKVRNFLFEAQLRVFTAMPKDAHITDVTFRSIICLN